MQDFLLLELLNFLLLENETKRLSCVTILDQTVISQHTSESNFVFITTALSVITDRLIFTEYLYVLITAASIYEGCSHAEF